MTDVLDFIAQHWGIITAAASGVGVLVIAIVKATPTKKDDEILKHVTEGKKYLRNFRDEE